MNEQRTYKILSLDGGGIKGVFPAALLARLEEHLEEPIGRYFDLIVGTSTGGIIAIGLGMGLTASAILDLYVEKGPAIFGQNRHPALNEIRRRVPGVRKPKHSSAPLEEALKGVLSDRRLGESRNRLVIPAWNRELERVYLYKTAHHPRLETDFRQPAIDAAMATAAAPTFFAPYLTSAEVELVDGGVWANNPIGVAVTEAVGMLGWPADRLKVLSIGTIAEVRHVPRKMTSFQMVGSLYVTQLFMAGQAHGAMGAARIITGENPNHKAIWRIDQQAPKGRYGLDHTQRIAELKSRAFSEARDQLPVLRQHFFDDLAEPFVPHYQLEAA